MNILNIFIVTLTLFFINCWLYLFFSRKLRDILLYPIENTENLLYIKILFLTSFLLLMLFFFLIIYKQFFINNQKNNGLSRWLKKVNDFITKINIFYIFYKIVFEFLGLYYTIHLLTLAKIVLNANQKSILCLTFCFVSLPRIIILFTFVTETCFGRLHYFFYTLFLLIIPLIARLVIFLLTDLKERLFPVFDEFVIKTPETMVVKTNNGIEKIDVITLSFIDSMSDVSFDNFSSNIYYPLIHIEDYMKNYFFPIYLNFVYYTALLYYFILSTGLFYVVYYN